MTPSHHPSDETLFSLAAGNLAAGPRIVVATHVSGCPRCRDRVRAFEAVGGAWLADQPAAAIGSDLLERTLARIDAAAASSPSRDSRPRPATHWFSKAFSAEQVLANPPATLRRCEFGPWRSLQKGVQMSRVKIPGESRANVVLLKVAAGFPTSEHGHDGVEYTQVLTGAFSDKFGHYGAGDYVEADDDVDHIPVVDADAECICLAAIEGRLRLRSFAARLLQPLIGL